MQFEFTVDKQNNTVNVKREFAAPVALVWKAWTTAELLDQWWAPKPFEAKTKSMDFREGGMWLYAMIGPDDGNNFCAWCRNDYEKILDNKMFTGLDAFCDEEGKVNPELPRTKWETNFAALGDKTLVTIAAKYDKLADLEKIIEMGFQEGFTMALGNLDELLVNLNK